MCKYIKDWLGFKLKPAVNIYSTHLRMNEKKKKKVNIDRLGLIQNSPFAILSDVGGVDVVNYLVNFLL